MAGLVLGGRMLGCSCFSSFSPCSALEGNEAVFVGMVLESGGGTSGRGPSRVLVEEGFHNAPKVQETVVIDKGAGSSCGYNLRVGERYVIYAAKKEVAGRVSLRIEGCSMTFRVRGSGDVVDAVREALRGGAAGIAGSVRRKEAGTGEKGMAGVRVVVRSETNRYETVTSVDVNYGFRGVVPGSYELEVTKSGYERVPGRDTGLLNGDLDRVGRVIARDGSCKVLRVEILKDGRISGRVTGRDDRPIEGIEVQAFELDRPRGNPLGQRLTVATDARGNFVFTQLQDGEYLVGVNADGDRDLGPYRRTVFTGDGGGSRPSRVNVEEGLSPSNIDLKLGEKRVAAVLAVRVVGPDGILLEGASVRLLTAGGSVRWDGRGKTSAAGLLEIPVYESDEYVVEAKSSGSNRREGKSSLQVVGERTSVTVVVPSLGVW